MDPRQLTSRQRKVLNFIQSFLDKKPYPPTLSEIAEKFGISAVGARNHLLLMQKKGVLRYVPNISRGIELLLPKRPEIPVYGSAPAGHPFTSQENIVDSFAIQRYLTSSKDIFGVYVRGDSMQDAQLSDGDLLFVDPKKEPRNGEIVIAAVEGEPTVKRFYREGETMRLQPENKKYKPIVVSKNDENFKIYGVVVGMIRALDKKKIDRIIDSYRKAS